MWHKGVTCLQTKWSLVLNEKLNNKKDNREEALSYGKYSVRALKKNETLIDHIPFELSRLIDYFIERKLRFTFGCEAQKT